MNCRKRRKKKDCSQIIENVTQDPMLKESTEFILFNETTKLEKKVRKKQQRKKPRKPKWKGPTDSQVDAWTAANIRMIESAERIELCIEKHPSPLVLRSLSAEDGEGIPNVEVSRKDPGDKACEFDVARMSMQSLHDSIALSSHHCSTSERRSPGTGSGPILASNRSVNTEDEESAKPARNSVFVVKQRGHPHVARRSDASRICGSSEDFDDSFRARRHNRFSNVFGSMEERIRNGVEPMENRIRLASLRKSDWIVSWQIGGEESFLREMHSRLANVNTCRMQDGLSRPLFLTSTPLQERSALLESRRNAWNISLRTTRFAEEGGSVARSDELDVGSERIENPVAESSRISGSYGIEEEEDEVEEESPSEKEPCSSSSSGGEEEKWNKVSATELSLMRKSAFWAIASKAEPSNKMVNEGKLGTGEIDSSDGCRSMSIFERREQLPFYLVGYRRWSKTYAANRNYLSEILHICCQNSIRSWRQLKGFITVDGRKLGEGSYGEVFLVKYDGHPAALKVVPVGMEKLDWQTPLKAILPELIVSRELSALRDNDTNRTDGFIRLFGAVVVKGLYPKMLVKSWKKFESEHETYNEDPGKFTKDQHYLLFAFENGGIDLEKYKIESVTQAYSILYQIAVAVAVAEVELDFEHRDLHVGNVLVSKVAVGEQRKERVLGHEIVIDLHGASTKIIDFSISRIYKATSVIFANLEDDEEIFEGKNDFQFDVYRLMRKANRGNWVAFNPQTNAMWLIYLAAFCWKHLNDREVGTESERIDMFQHFLSVRCNKGRMLNWVLESSARVSEIISVSVA